MPAFSFPKFNTQFSLPTKPAAPKAPAQGGVQGFGATATTAVNAATGRTQGDLSRVGRAVTDQANNAPHRQESIWRGFTGQTQLAHAPQGNDMTSPGTGEQYFDNTQSSYVDPSKVDNWWGSHGSQYDDPQASQDYLGQVKQAYDGRSLSQNLDPYYDRAFDVGAGRINKQMAARGMYGSSAATDQIGQLSANLGAEQANREGQYGLQVDAANRSWMDQLGQAAGLADSTRLNYLDSSGQAALATSNSDLQRITAGQDAAGSAQRSRENRIGSHYEREKDFADTLGGYKATADKNTIDADRDMFLDQWAAKLGMSREALNQRMQKDAEFRQWVSTAATYAAAV